ncbi:hypothetical protein BC781_101620 [Sediminitomix flava]|uniref:Uncharacterized protein n=1 Tax=Sediminitomix flava TaxID=379075 RepID=A0A315ZGL4_SEDFL|nr:hypothetical protein BC781_101620 [Sediminitomix flava]
MRHFFYGNTNRKLIGVSVIFHLLFDIFFSIVLGVIISDQGLMILLIIYVKLLLYFISWGLVIVFSKPIQKVKYVFVLMFLTEYLSTIIFYLLTKESPVPALLSVLYVHLDWAVFSVTLFPIILSNGMTYYLFKKEFLNF